MHVCACLLLCFISMFACIDLGFAMLFPSVGLWLSVFGATCLRDCLCPSWNLFGCDRLWGTSLWCWCAWWTPFSSSCGNVMFALLALCHSFGFLYFFAFLHTSLHVHAWVCVSFILQSNGTMDIQSKPTFFLLGHPLLFDNMLFAPVWLSLIVCALACFPSRCFFVCLLACFSGDSWNFV